MTGAANRCCGNRRQLVAGCSGRMHTTRPSCIHNSCNTGKQSAIGIDDNQRFIHIYAGNFRCPFIPAECIDSLAELGIMQQYPRNDNHHNIHQYRNRNVSEKLALSDHIKAGQQIADRRAARINKHKTARDGIHTERGNKRRDVRCRNKPSVQRT